VTGATEDGCLGIAGVNGVVRSPTVGTGRTTAGTRPEVVGGAVGCDRAAACGGGSGAVLPDAGG
jgi:hypothetical protein